MRANPFLVAAWALSFVWVASLFVVPYTIEPGTVRGLDGRANVIDYADRWSELPFFAAAVYTFGDFNCHQMAHRSWTLNGNQLPVDTRMTAGFVGAALALPFVLLLSDLPRMRDQFAQLVPGRVRSLLVTPQRRLAFLWIAAAIMIGPALVDLAFQFGGTESTNWRRTWTGLLMGAGLALVVGVCVKSLLAPIGQATSRRVAVT